MRGRRLSGSLPLIGLWALAQCGELGAPAASLDASTSNGDVGTAGTAGTTGGTTTGTAGTTTTGEDGSPTLGTTMATTTGPTEGTDDATAADTGTEPAGLYPELLSQTGLYADIAADIVAADVHFYTPRFELWSDTAEKRRWLWLPPGTQIDTSDIDEWVFPEGTKVWKEFSRDGVRVETRMLEKLPPGMTSIAADDWALIAYVWNEDQTDAVATPLGLQNAKNTPHDVPDEETCLECHDMRDDKPLGVSAIQLAHDGAGMTLTTMAADGLISDPPTVSLELPGDATDQAALGYLHANCGHCHRARAPNNQRLLSLQMWLESDQMQTVEATPAYVALVNQASESLDNSLPGSLRIQGGDPQASEVVRRIGSRGVDDPQMPPVGTEDPDQAAIDLLTTWIQALPPPPGQ